MMELEDERTGLEYSHLLAASNLSLFFFLFHFQGLKRRPSAENFELPPLLLLLALSGGGDL